MKQLFILASASLIAVVITIESCKDEPRDLSKNFQLYKDSVNLILAEQDKSISNLQGQLEVVKSDRDYYKSRSNKVINKVKYLSRQEAFELFVDNGLK